MTINHKSIDSFSRTCRYEELHVTWDISREGSSEANTPDVEHERRFPSSHTFPPPELRTTSPSQRRDQRYIRFGRPRTDSGGIPRAGTDKLINMLVLHLSLSLSPQ